MVTDLRPIMLEPQYRVENRHQLSNDGHGRSGPLHGNPDLALFMYSGKNMETFVLAREWFRLGCRQDM